LTVRPRPRSPRQRPRLVPPRRRPRSLRPLGLATHGHLSTEAAELFARHAHQPAPHGRPVPHRTQPGTMATRPRRPTPTHSHLQPTLTAVREHWITATRSSPARVRNARWLNVLFVCPPDAPRRTGTTNPTDGGESASDCAILPSARTDVQQGDHHGCATDRITDPGPDAFTVRSRDAWLSQAAILLSVGPPRPANRNGWTTRKASASRYLAALGAGNSSDRGSRAAPGRRPRRPPHRPKLTDPPSTSADSWLAS